MPDYLLSDNGITRLEEINTLIAYIMEVNNLTEQEVIIEFNKNSPGTSLNMPLKFLARGVYVTQEYYPYCIIADSVREIDKYVLVNPTLSDEIREEIKDMSLE